MERINRITAAWKDRASVRGWFPEFHDDGRLDYPLGTLPAFEVDDRARYEETKASIATCLWQQYNFRTILAEDAIANPAIDLLLESSSIRPAVKEALLQTAVDERFHTYFHRLALRDAEARATTRCDYVRSITVRELGAALDREADAKKRRLIQIAYAVVAEVSVNAFLEVLSKAKDIRRANRDLVDKHNRDERFHTVTFVEATKDLLANEDDATKTYLCERIHDAKTSFLQHDYAMYERVFHAHGLACTFSKSAGTTMSRDMSGVNRLLELVDTSAAA